MQPREAFRARADAQPAHHPGEVGTTLRPPPEPPGRYRKQARADRVGGEISKDEPGLAAGPNPLGTGPLGPSSNPRRRHKERQVSSLNAAVVAGVTRDLSNCSPTCDAFQRKSTHQARARLRSAASD
jgi:hypothetical protein